MKGKLIIFSAPSGAGKSTIVGNILKHYPGTFEFSVSATSRNPRGSERDGVEYYFLSAERFRELIAQDAFVEHEEVYKDRFYGTLKSEVERIWADGKVIIFDVDVKGGVNLKKYFGENALSFLIVPPSLEILESRLRGRGTDSEEDILSYALFPQVAKKFFEYRRAQKYKVDSTLVDKENKIYPV